MTNAFQKAVAHDKPKAPSTPATNEKSVYTMYMDNSDLMTRNTIMSKVQHDLGPKVKISDVLRSLMVLMVDDPTLYNQVIDELKSREEK